MSVDSCVLPGGPGASLGDPLLDRYVVFVAGRARPNTVLATVSDLRLFFAVVGKDPREVAASDVLDFITEQRRPRGDGRVVRLADGQGGLSSQTIKRRLSSVSGLYSWLLILGEVSANPVPRGLSTRRPRGQQQATVPLVRAPRTLPRVLAPAEVDALISALRRWRDRAMVEAMVLGGLRRCEVLGLRLADLRIGDRQVFIVEGKGGHQRLIPMSAQFFMTVARYLDRERPVEATTDRVFVVLKGPRRGLPLTAAGGGRSAGRRPPSAKVTTPGPPGTSAPRRGWRTRYSGRRPNSVSDRVGQVPAHTTTRCSARDRASWRGWSRRRRGSAR